MEDMVIGTPVKVTRAGQNKHSMSFSLVEWEKKACIHAMENKHNIYLFITLSVYIFFFSFLFFLIIDIQANLCVP
jgi:hypothetical protein